MLKKSILFLSIFTLNVAHAETCPSLNDIRAGLFHQWQPLDIDNAEPLTDEALQAFENSATQFAMARWVPDAPEGSGECFYYGATRDPDYLGVYLAKMTSEPDLKQGNWRQTQLDEMQCDNNINDCRFKEN